ncbi:hypothetical protein ACFL47_05160 [Candidatus Latescibacterota bacterium]
MNDRHTEFRDRLLAQEKTTTEYENNYRKEIRMLVEKKLSTVHKTGNLIISILNFGLAVLCVYAAYRFNEWKSLARISALLFGTVFMGVSVFIGWTVKRGSINLKAHPTIISTGFWIFSIVLMVVLVFLQLQLDNAKSLHLLMNGLFVLIVSAVYLITNSVKQSEIKTHERLLGLEYRIAEVAEKKGRSNE